MFKYYRKFQAVLILSMVTFSISIHAMEFSPTTFKADFQPKPDYGCTPQYGKLACRWEGECADLGRVCASCLVDFRYSRALNECYKCPEGNSLNSQNRCS